MADLDKYSFLHHHIFFDMVEYE